MQLKRNNACELYLKRSQIKELYHANSIIAQIAVDMDKDTMITGNNTDYEISEHDVMKCYDVMAKLISMAYIEDPVVVKNGGASGEQK